MRGLPQKQNARRADKIRLCGHLRRYKKIVKKTYIIYNKRYGLLSSDLWIDTGFHCGECLEVLLDDEWVQTRMEMNPAREWYLVGTPYCGDLEYIRARIPE